MSEELKPCPFCGGSDLVFAYIGRERNPEDAPVEAYTFSQHVECRGCGLSTGRAQRVVSTCKNTALHHAHLKAVSMWNRRAAPAAQAVDEYQAGMIAAQKLCDRIAGDHRGRSDKERKGAGECSAAIRAALAAPAQSEQEPSYYRVQTPKIVVNGEVTEWFPAFIWLTAAEVSEFLGPIKIVEKLYAAPVRTVSLPDRENENGFENDQSEQAIGFNRALDLVAQLNAN